MTSPTPSPSFGGSSFSNASQLSGSAPAAPGYTSPWAGSSASIIPEASSASQIAGQAMAAEQMLPPELRATGNPDLNLSAEQLARYEDAYKKQYIDPMIAKQQAAYATNGRGTSSFGGAQLGQMQAQGALSALQAGLDISNQRAQLALQKRGSFFGNEGQMAQAAETNKLNRGYQVAGLDLQNAQNQNQFNLGVYGTQTDNYWKGNQMAQSESHYNNDQSLGWAKLNSDNYWKNQDYNMQANKMNADRTAQNWAMGAQAGGALAKGAGAAASRWFP